MKIETNYFGDVEIDEQAVIQFQQGIPGFLEEKQFVLLAFDESVTFQVLQSVQTKDLAFIVVAPFDFISDYQLKLDDATLDQLKIETEEEVLVVCLVTLKETLDKSTANLQAPVIINTEKKLAKQLILHQSNYQTKEPIFSHLVEKGAK